VALNAVQLTLDLYDGAGNPVTSGYAYFTPSSVLTDTMDGETIAQSPIVAAFDNSSEATVPAPAPDTGQDTSPATGLPVVSLYATDNANLAPAGWTWSVTFQLPSSVTQIDPFTFLLPYTGGASQKLSAVIAAL
jgi:hypothetical protein